MDLCTEDLGAVPASELFSAVEEFLRTDELAADRLEEGYLIDFKREWGEEAVKSIAAFTNTFGGILLVGVSDHGGRAG